VPVVDGGGDSPETDLKFVKSWVWALVPLLLYQVILVSKEVTLPLLTMMLQFPAASHLPVGTSITVFIVPSDTNPDGCDNPVAGDVILVVLEPNSNSPLWEKLIL
jgi:hypothetical protein